MAGPQGEGAAAAVGHPHVLAPHRPSQHILTTTAIIESAVCCCSAHHAVAPHLPPLAHQPHHCQHHAPAAPLPVLAGHPAAVASPRPHPPHLSRPRATV